MEWVNPTASAERDELLSIAERMMLVKTTAYEVARPVKRGLDYYVDDGFEIFVPALGAQKQVVGGGAYAQGMGSAIGFDQLMLASDHPGS